MSRVFEERRQLLKRTAALAASGLLVSPLVSGSSKQTAWGDGVLTILSDGDLALPGIFPLADANEDAEIKQLFKKYGLPVDQSSPDCNLAVWQSADRNVLFDLGSGPNFMPTSGKLLSSMEEAGLDPQDITDVLFTHAHPDHLWGLLDEFDDLLCPNAEYHMARQEWDYWRADNTLDRTPEHRKSFVVGAQNRFAYLEDQISLFDFGQEVVAGIEALDTSGHTPGHTSFALYNNSDSLVLLGDAVTHIALSFEKPGWLSPSDQDPAKAAQTRGSLLDRLSVEKSAIVGFHLPHPGHGRVMVEGQHYRYEPFV